MEVDPADDMPCSSLAVDSVLRMGSVSIPNRRFPIAAWWSSSIVWCFSLARCFRNYLCCLKQKNSLQAGVIWGACYGPFDAKRLGKFDFSFFQLLFPCLHLGYLAELMKRKHVEFKFHVFYFSTAYANFWIFFSFQRLKALSNGFEYELVTIFASCSFPFKSEVSKKELFELCVNYTLIIVWLELFQFLSFYCEFWAYVDLEILVGLSGSSRASHIVSYSVTYLLSFFVYFHIFCYFWFLLQLLNLIFHALWFCWQAKTVGRCGFYCGNQSLAVHFC